MIKISCLLQQWGTWLRLHPKCEFSTPPAGMRRLKVVETSPPPCTEIEAAMLTAIFTSLQTQGQQKETELVLRHYVYGESKSAIARKWRCSEARIRQSLQVIESFVAGVIFASYSKAYNDIYFEQEESTFTPDKKNNKNNYLVSNKRY